MTDPDDDASPAKDKVQVVEGFAPTVSASVAVKPKTGSAATHKTQTTHYIVMNEEGEPIYAGCDVVQIRAASPTLPPAAPAAPPAPAESLPRAQEASGFLTAELKAWYLQRIQELTAAGCQSSRAEDVKAATNKFGKSRGLTTAVRDLRRTYAPGDWSKGGRPPKKPVQ